TAKLAAEEYLAAWNRLHGTRHTSLRFANVYGPRQEADLAGGVVAIFLEAMAAGKASAIYGDGLQTRDFVHVADVVAARPEAPGGGGVFNAGSGGETTVAELHERCRAVSGDDRPPRMEQAREGDLLHSVLDVSLAERELGWRPQISLDEGLRRTWDWIQ